MEKNKTTILGEQENSPEVQALVTYARIKGGVLSCILRLYNVSLGFGVFLYPSTSFFACSNYIKQMLLQNIQ